jgi:SAM-dependent methyltransferase
MTFGEAVRFLSEHLPLHGYTRREWSETYVERHRPAYEHIISTIVDLVPAGGSILDYGAGLCDKTALAQLMGYRCAVVDDFNNPLYHEPAFRDSVFSFARRTGIDVHAVSAGEPMPFGPASFDMIMLHDVIEHLHDSPRELLNDLVELLKPGGLLFITVPNAVNLRKRIDVFFGRTNLPRYDTFYWYPGPWRGHVREYTKGDLEALCEFLGLERVKLHGCHHMLSVLPAPVRLPYRAVTSVLQGCRDSWCFVGRKPPAWEARRNVSTDALDSILHHLNR